MPWDSTPTGIPRGLKYLAVGKVADAYLAAATVRIMARDAGFAEREIEEIVLCAVELATNMALHAGGGVMGMQVLDNGGRKGVELLGEDRGPGIPDVETLLADGNSARGGLGFGLGTVNRLMDSLEVLSPTGPDGGTRVRCSRMFKPDHVPDPGSPLDAGAATRPVPGQRFNGDAFVIKTWGRNMLVGVIDGLGHGQFAQKASLSARRYVETHWDLPLDALFQGVDRACRATRGVVMALALFDWGRSRVSLAAVGNVMVRHRGPSDISFVYRRGYLGAGTRPVAVSEHDWTRDDVLVMHSDGVRGRWAWEDVPVLFRKPAQEAASDMLRGYARDNDDATLVVVKGRAAGSGPAGG